jgi:hypothetical protein
VTDQYSDYVPIKWEAAEFVPVTNGGLATSIEGVSCTVLSKGDDYLLAFSFKVSGATLPTAETMVKAVAAGIHTILDDVFDAEWKPENEGE